MRQADARVPVSEIRIQAADIDQTINQEITFARLCSGFAMLALAPALKASRIDPMTAVRHE